MKNIVVFEYFQKAQTIMPTQVISINVALPTDYTSEFSFYDRASLLDGEIILFSPPMMRSLTYFNHSNGKPSLDTENSYRFLESCDHWRKQITLAFEAGKTIFIYLTQFERFLVDNRNRESLRTERISNLEETSNYHCLPIQLDPDPSTGVRLDLSPEYRDIFSSYWQEFRRHSDY